ncbi:unnamed protein product [Allacma fusca]|uniref:Uncharacterized protein n=1 Tax=Allacma fusca TaxID=39272 RepID=A0A8J2Q3V7_9HEXA|nr:unnamed protein product [Allacma fusca]
MKFMLVICVLALLLCSMNTFVESHKTKEVEASKRKNADHLNNLSLSQNHRKNIIRGKLHSVEILSATFGNSSESITTLIPRIKGEERVGRRRGFPGRGIPGLRHGGQGGVLTGFNRG